MQGSPCRRPRVQCGRRRRRRRLRSGERSHASLAGSKKKGGGQNGVVRLHATNLDENYKEYLKGSLPNKKRQNSLQSKAFPMVEMGGLEPPTPYMRSKCSTS